MKKYTQTHTHTRCEGGATAAYEKKKKKTCEEKKKKEGLRTTFMRHYIIEKNEEGEGEESNKPEEDRQVEGEGMGKKDNLRCKDARTLLFDEP